MSKLRLRIDELQVDSFTTDAPASDRGTVLAHISCRCTNAQGGTCGGGASCNAGPTCDADCSGITYVDSCPCDTYNCNSIQLSCTDPTCVDTCDIDIC